MIPRANYGVLHSMRADRAAFAAVESPHTGRDLLPKLMAAAAEVPAGFRYVAVVVEPGVGLKAIESECLDDFLAAMSIRGFEPTGELESNPRLREELRGQPIMSGLSGPCYGGPGIIRYESSEAYNILST